MTRRFELRVWSARVALVWGGWLVLLLAAWALFVRPAISEAAGLRLASSPQRVELERREKDVGRVEAFRVALDTAREDLIELRDILATRRTRLIAVQRELARLATQFRAKHDTVVNENEDLVVQGLDRFAMVVSLEGTYADLRRFLQAVEQSKEFLVVEQVALAENREGGVLLQLNVVLATYFAPEPRPGAVASAVGG